MRQMSFEEMKIVQLDTLQTIDRFCEEHNIKYSLACGTLIGAIRHKGYIPWDDDIDIYLLREDYEKLEKEFPAEYEHIAFATLDRDKDYDRSYGKAYDTRTVVVETEVQNKTLGVNIDVFPIDNAPGIGEGWEQYNKYRLPLQKIFLAKMLTLNFKKNKLRLLGKMVVKVCTCFISLREYAKYLNHIAQKYNAEDMEYVFENAQGLVMKRPFLKKNFNSYVKVPFEDRMFYAMGGYDNYLTNAYGDYMTPPPAKNRVAHHSFVPYWKD